MLFWKAAVTALSVPDAAATPLSPVPRRGGDRSLCSGRAATAISCDAAATAISCPDAPVTALVVLEAAVTALSVPDAAATAISCPDAAATALSVPDAAVTAIPVPDAAVTAIPVPDAAVTAIPVPDAAVTAIPVPDAAATAISVPDAAVTALVVLEAAVTALSVPDATVTADVPLVARPAHLRVSFDESMAAGGFEDTSVQPYHFEPESDPERDDAPKKFGNYGLDRTYLNEKKMERLSDILASYPSAEPQRSSASSWSFRQQKASDRWKEARPDHLKCLIVKESVGHPLCWLCHEPAVIRCTECLPEEWFCGECDVLRHKKQPLYNRECVINGFFEAIPSTSYAIKGEDGYHDLAMYPALFIQVVMMSLQKRFFWVNTTAEDESSEQSILSERVIHHPQFNYLTTDNDIMLIKLSKPATLSEYVKTLDLPKSCAPPDTMCRVSGWGITMNNMVDSDKLQCLNLSIISDLDCNKSYPCLITASMFCAGYLEGGKGVCKGDSGGPLVSNGELQGIQRVAVMLRKISLVSLPRGENSSNQVLPF
ncbi:trypsin-1 isoform X5 [Labeo rohita]|uniref:Trypsin-1 isoform X5 n=1 Tax=Labeo rohita TaxID=84645 RepID=A0A498N0Z9_LABRO|nr:trypsin-1 isoform X5 [Labeo rohita]